MLGLGWHFTHTQPKACKEVKYIKVNTGSYFRPFLTKNWMYWNLFSSSKPSKHTTYRSVYGSNQAVNRTPKVPPACLLLPPCLFVLLSVNEGGNRTGKWVEDKMVRGGLHLKVFNSSCSHICTRKKKNKIKKITVTEGNTTTPGIHGPQHEEGSE